MADYPFLLQLDVTLTSGGTGTLTHTVPNNEKLVIDELVFNQTGIFNIIGITVSGGRNISNASNNKPIPSVVLQKGTNQFNHIGKFLTNLILSGGETLTIELLDTSAGSNLVQLTANCIRTV